MARRAADGAFGLNPFVGFTGADIRATLQQIAQQALQHPQLALRHAAGFLDRAGPRGLNGQPTYRARSEGQTVPRPGLEGKSLVPRRAAHLSGLAAAPVCVRRRCRSVVLRRRARAVRAHAADRGAGADQHAARQPGRAEADDRDRRRQPRARPRHTCSTTSPTTAACRPRSIGRRSRSGRTWP